MTHPAQHRPGAVSEVETSVVHLQLGTSPAVEVNCKANAVFGKLFYYALAQIAAPKVPLGRFGLRRLVGDVDEVSFH